MSSTFTRKFIERDENIFDLDEPQSYSCQLRHFTWSHPVLWVHVHKINTSYSDLHIVFQIPKYIEAPTRWVNANFRLAPVEECFDLISRYENLPADIDLETRIHYEQDFRLFTVTSDNGFHIKILAMDAYISDKPIV